MIDGFAILNLWNERNYRIEFKEGNLIIVGENGCGKTTVLKLLYYVLSKNWAFLADENFEAIELSAGEEKICIKSSDLVGLEDCLINIENDLKSDLPPMVYRKIRSFCEEWATSEQVLKACEVYGVPDVYLHGVKRIIEEKNRSLSPDLIRINEWIDRNNPYRVIYFPTYRRSEKYSYQDENLESRIRRHKGYYNLVTDIEVVKEGMGDVNETIENKISEIRREYDKSASELNIKCFEGILTQQYKDAGKIDDDFMNEDAIAMVFNSFSSSEEFIENIGQIKNKLLELLTKTESYDEYDRIVIYFYSMLIERYKQLKELEEPLEAFFYACNKYLTQKRFEYRPNEFKYEIVLDRKNQDVSTIDLNHLSSGEKQLVSLFNYVYLATNSKCMIIIDEPELSLSVDWQMSILEDVINSQKCGSLIAATQSPFVYDNSLESVARTLDSFLTME